MDAKKQPNNSIIQQELLEQLRNFIYNQKYAGSMYLQLATMTDNQEQKTFLTNFSVTCDNNISYLNRYYQLLMTSSYSPIVKEPEITGTYNYMLLQMIKYEGLTYHDFSNAAFNPLAPEGYQEMMQYIASTVNNRAILLNYMYLTNLS
jgi:hypothetical protein